MQKNDVIDILAKILKGIPKSCTLSRDCEKCEYEHDVNCVIYSQVDYLIKNDVVPVVKCKDCKNRNKKGICEKFRQRYPFYPEDDFHCGFGERSADNA